MVLLSTASNASKASIASTASTAFTASIAFSAARLTESVDLLSLRMLKLINSILSFVLSLPVWFYRYSVSPLFRPSCRHIPTCSQYMLDALKIHGPVRGSVMGIGRILRCRPGGTHGYDPVPRFLFRKYRPLSELFKRRPKEDRLKKY